MLFSALVFGKAEDNISHLQKYNLVYNVLVFPFTQFTSHLISTVAELFHVLYANISPKYLIKFDTQSFFFDLQA